VSVEDLRALAGPALRHRIILNFEGEAEAVDIDRLIADIVENAEGLIGKTRDAFVR
jgi:MoxR-like ATPase